MATTVLIAGGLCGTTMLRAAEMIEERCARRGLTVTVTIQNLWETSYVRPDYHLIVEMFPFFENQRCPVFSGKPFISRKGEEALLVEIADCLCGKAVAM